MMRLAQIAAIAVVLFGAAPAMALEDTSLDVPAHAIQKTMRMNAIVHRVSDRMVLVAVPVDAAAEANLAAIGFRRAPRIEAVEGRTLFAGHAYFEYELAEKPLLAALIEAKTGRMISFELERDASGRAVVVDVR